MKMGKKLTILLALAALLAVPASASAELRWDVKATWADTNLKPGEKGQFEVRFRNVGEDGGTSPFQITDQLPAGVTITGIRWGSLTAVPGQGPFGPLPLVFLKLPQLCSGIGTSTLTCNVPLLAPATEPPLQAKAAEGLSRPGFPPPPILIDVAVDPGASGEGTNTATVSGAGAPEADTDTDQVPFDSAQRPFGIVPGSYLADLFSAAYPFGEPARQAGDRPFELRVDFDLNRRYDENAIGAGFTPDVDLARPVGVFKTAEVTLPRGAIFNPEATPKCDPVLFAGAGASESSTACPPDTQLGYLDIQINQLSLSSVVRNVAFYNLEPPHGVPSDFGFKAAGLVQGHIYGELDPAQDYAIKSLTPDVASFVPVKGTNVTFWGVPADPAHDKFRYFSEKTEGKEKGASFGSAPIRPLITNPMDCGFDNGGSRIRLESYSSGGIFTPVQEYGDPLNVKGCDDPRFRFAPDIALQPTSKDAGGPTGLAVHLELPQRNDVVGDATDLYAQNGKVKAIPTPPVKKAVVTLPQGMTVNPAAAQGLSSCSPAQIGLGTDSPVTCPDSSQFGTLELHTPLLPIDEQPEGFVYVAKQNDNPFHNFLSLYLVIQEPERGILVKVPGRVDLDPVTGQITTTFDDIPQFPLEDMEMNLKGGLRSGLVNPQTCGVKTIEATFYSWHDPSTPHTVNSSFEVTRNPDGSPCRHSLSERPFDPQLSGGTVNNLAGSFSPLELAMTRSDEDQELAKVEGTAPPGLLASLRGVSRCTDAAIAAAANPGRTGTEEINSPSCPASSQVGTVDAGAGVGQVLTYVKGKVYLAGPYKGAPLSGVAIVPAVAGPFDLGNVVTRAPAYPDPRTAEIKLVTDDLPQIFKGVPVRVRDIRVHLDRHNFTLNPTNCDPFRLQGTLFSSEGKSKQDGSPFQAAECASLGFKPKLSARLIGGTKRGAHPKFRATFRAREGDANVSGAVVTLPRSAFLDQAHIRTICTRVQFRANACPTAAIYGYAEARTPLLEAPLKGPVYLRSSDHNLPDLVADLNGEIPVEVVGRIDSIKGGIRASFEDVPDAPVESFTIAMQGGKKGLLVNSRDICAHAYRIEADFSAQNGKGAQLRPPLAAKCKKAKAKRSPKR